MLHLKNPTRIINKKLAMHTDPIKKYLKLSSFLFLTKVNCKDLYELANAKNTLYLKNKT